MKGSTSDAGRTERRDFLLSLAALGLVFAAVLGGLAYDENWRKLLRVLAGAAVYVGLLLSAWRWRRGGEGRPPFWAFALAAGAAELASGWLRPGTHTLLTLWVAPAAALLLGGAHWLALSTWRALRARLVPAAEPRDEGISDAL